MQVDNLTSMKNNKLKVCNNVSTSVKELEEMVKVEKVTSHLRQRGAVDQIGNGRKACANFSHFGFSAKKKGEKWKTVSISCSALGGAKLTRT